jgi:enediyne biosynthesis protein E4
MFLSWNFRRSGMRYGGRFTLMLLILLAPVAGCERRGSPRQAAKSSDPSSAELFEDVTAKSKLDFVQDCGPTGNYFMPQTVGSGAALVDYDNDGRLDIYLLNNGGPEGARNKLFHQEPDGTFKDVSGGSGLDIAGYCMGVAIGDVNNDGLPDVLVTQYTGVRLFLNLGGGHFRDATREAGLDDPQWATSAAFIDYDRDGRLDLVVANYGDYNTSIHCTDQAGKPEYCGPNSLSGTVSRLYHNVSRGGAVRFEDVTAASGLGSKPGWGLGAVCLDFDGDGWPDIFITNDAHPNYLWINQHDGTFKEEAALRGIAYDAMGVPQANMGIAIGDMRQTGMFDLYVTHLTEENNVLWSQSPAGYFQDRTAAAGLIGEKWHATGFGAVFADFRQSGFPDLAVVNGRVRRSQVPGAVVPLIASLGAHWSAYAERNQLFANDGSGRLRDISEANATFCGQAAIGRALCCGDIFGDGSMSLLATYIHGPARLYRNIAPHRGHWLIIKAIDPALGGRDAYGARVRIHAAGRWRAGWVNPGYSYACSNDPQVHFGLGDATVVDTIEVTWPDGSKEGFSGTPADRHLILHKGQGKAGDKG